MTLQERLVSEAREQYQQGVARALTTETYSIEQCLQEIILHTIEQTIKEGEKNMSGAIDLIRDRINYNKPGIGRYPQVDKEVETLIWCQFQIEKALTDTQHALRGIIG